MTKSEVGKRARIAPDWTLGQLKESFPGVELALFAFFGVGSRERSGFAASEILSDLLRRHLIFDADSACARLDAMAAEDWQHELSPKVLGDRLETESITILDARSAEDHAFCRLSGSQLLSADSVGRLRADPVTPVVVVCNDGSQAPAASRHLRGLGLRASHLKGGLTAWAIDVDESFPIIYPLKENADRWHLLAGGRTLRYRREQPLAGQAWKQWSRRAMEQHSELRKLTEQLPDLELVATTPHSFSARAAFGDLSSAIAVLRPWKERPEVWNDGGEETTEAQEREALQRVLAEEAPKILQSHKGTVEIESYHDRVLSLRLGGGCAGCASASITTQRELAAALYNEVPLLDRIVGSC